MWKGGKTWTVKGIPAVLLVLLAIPLAGIAALFGRGKSVERTPEEVARRIESFIEGAGDEWDWDDLVSLNLADPRLDALVSEAAQSGPPYEEDKLRDIVGRVRALRSA